MHRHASLQAGLQDSFDRQAAIIAKSPPIKNMHAFA
jgi:hypothetical protein